MQGRCRKPPKAPPKLFETRSQAWREVGLLRQISPRVVKRARLEALVLVPVFVAIVVYLRPPRTSCSAPAWRLGTTAYRASMHLERRSTPRYHHHRAAADGARLGDRARHRAGHSGRRCFGGSTPPPPAPSALSSASRRSAWRSSSTLRVAGIAAGTLALGGAFTAVIIGLAAQQTLGNLIAGTVLLSARPFRVGERVRLQGGPIAGQSRAPSAHSA